MALEKWFTAVVTDIIDVTENTKRFFFKVPELEVFHFIPGQFITVDLPIHHKKNHRWRSYSIASAPDGTNQFELVIVHAPHGLGTNYIWKELHAGSTLLFKGPSGSFILPNEITEDICLIATGTGIAPFRSMLLDLVRNPRPYKNIYLIFGSRYLKDLLYREELETLEKRLPGFKFLFSLSRETSPEFTGYKGYVHPLYEELFADKRPAQFYLCGWRNMVDEARERIRAMGYDSKSVRVELYG
ncbi:MAG: FAD-binding oxidoreductase [Chitinophagales bacterium]